MHILEGMEVIDSSANISKITLNLRFGELPKSKLNLLVQAAFFSILQYHISDVLFFFVVVVEQLDNIWVVELMMDIYFFFGIPTMNLNRGSVTILTATISSVSAFWASLTSP